MGLVLGYLIARELHRGEGPFESTTPAMRKGSAGGLQGDAVYLWQLQCGNRRASREYLMKRGEMSAHRWNKASNLIAFLGLQPGKVSYQEGVDAIRQEVRMREELAKTKGYVAPY